MIGRLFQDHPRSLGMSWAEHGAGAVVIGARMIGAGAGLHRPCRGPGAVHRDRGADVVDLHDAYDQAQGRRGQSQCLARL